MPSAQVSLIQLYGANPSIAPQPEVGVEDVTGAIAGVGSGDGPVGTLDVAVPIQGTNRSLVQAFALRVIQPASPVTVISDVRLYVDQAGKNSLEGEWDDIELLTCDSSVDPTLLDAFDEASGPDQGKAADYVEATRTLGPQGYVGDTIETVYGISDVADLMADENLGRGLLDLTGLGRADGTTATFGQSVNDVSRMLLIQASFGMLSTSGKKPGVPITLFYDEVE